MNGRTGREPRFHDYLSADNIICGLEGKGSMEVIGELCAKLCADEPRLKLEEIEAAVAAREQVVPTVVSPGLAVPHARLADLDRIRIALGTSRNGVDFQAPGMPPVNVVILILTPKDNPALYLQILAALAKDFRNADTIRQVAAMENGTEILSFFSGVGDEIPEFLCAAHVMNKNPVTLLEADPLAKAIETFAVQRVFDIPVLDEDGDVRGVVSQEDILRLSLPEHLLWMDDLTPILHFQPFAEMLRNDSETKLADFMREEYVAVAADTPAIQLAKIFLNDGVRQILVVDKRKFLGVVNLHGFTTKLFWA